MKCEDCRITFGREPKEAEGEYRVGNSTLPRTRPWRVLCLECADWLRKNQVPVRRA